MNANVPTGNEPARCTPLERDPTGMLSVSGLDGSHMGVAVSWWQAQFSSDHEALDLIRLSVDPCEALRSGLEIVLSMVDWISRNDHYSSGDGGHLTLHRLSQDPLVVPSMRVLCADLAACLAKDVDPHTVTVHTTDVSSVMRLVARLAAAVESRFEVPIQDQIDTYRHAAIHSEVDE